MSFAERVVQWNRSYDNLPEPWRFQFVVWALLVVGAVNMLLTVVAHFPFALLVVLGIIVITAVRVPYVFKWVAASEAPATDARFQIGGANWLVDLNRRYDAMPESRRFWVYPVILLVGGAINMILTIGYGFPFGLLFLLVLLCLVAIRAPYAAGWFRPGDPSAAPPYGAEVTHAPMAAIASEPTPPDAARAPDLASPATRAPEFANRTPDRAESAIRPPEVGINVPNHTDSDTHPPDLAGSATRPSDRTDPATAPEDYTDPATRAAKHYADSATPPPDHTDPATFPEDHTDPATRASEHDADSANRAPGNSDAAANPPNQTDHAKDPESPSI